MGDEPHVVWRSGDPWRRLTPDLDDLAAATVISRSGTARFLNLTRRRHNRLAAPGGSRMWLDSTWRGLESVELTPCGLNIVGTIDWAMGTPIWLVLDGLVDDWASTTAGADVVAAIARGELPTHGPGHPPDPCGAVYCPHRT